MSIPTFFHGLFGRLWLCSLSFDSSGAYFCMHDNFQCYVSHLPPCPAKTWSVLLDVWLLLSPGGLHVDVSARLYAYCLELPLLVPCRQRHLLSLVRLEMSTISLLILVVWLSFGQPFLMTSDNYWRSLSSSIPFFIVTYSAFDFGQSPTRSIVSNCRHCNVCCCNWNTCSHADGSSVCLQLRVS